jgi:hypothetical protein
MIERRIWGSINIASIVVRVRSREGCFATGGVDYDDSHLGREFGPSKYPLTPSPLPIQTDFVSI